MLTSLKFAAAAAIFVMGAGAAVAQQPARLGGKPNLNGIWQAVNGANWDLEPHSPQVAPAAQDKIGAIGAIPGGLGVVEGGAIPYQPAALEQREKNRKSAPGADPEAACYLPGIPRATYMNHPFQIVQGDKGDMLVAYEYAAANRAILMKEVEVPPIDTWMGTSYGSWEGDTLKVVTLAQNGMTWLDRSGNYLSPTATVTERFKPNGPNHLLYEVTIEDPSIYSKPWKISMPLYRRIEPNAQIVEFRCVPFAEELLYGDLKPGNTAKK
ncbi:MAG: hypothetical protein JWM75_2858 [Sphingomonas bacterium]|jgi:hypothetical protein|nr:hypothetical protein [Sphingomonas bacterium]